MKKQWNETMGCVPSETLRFTLVYLFLFLDWGGGILKTGQIYERYFYLFKYLSLEGFNMHACVYRYLIIIWAKWVEFSPQNINQHLINIKIVLFASMHLFLNSFFFSSDHYFKKLSFIHSFSNVPYEFLKFYAMSRK